MAAPSQRARGAATALTSAISAPSGERARDDEHARQRHVRLGIGDAGKDRVVLEQALVSPEVDLDGEHQQHRRGGNRQPAPGSDAGVGATAEEPGASGNHDEEHRDAGDHHRDRQEPTADQLPRRQREQVEGERTAEDRVDDLLRARRELRGRAVPIQGQRLPVGHHAGAAGQRDEQRCGQRHQPEHRFNGQRQRLAVDQDAAARDLAESIRLEREKRSIEHGEGDDGEEREDSGLDVQRLPEDVGVAERSEPEGVDVVGKRRPAAQHQDCKSGQEKVDAAAASRWPRRGPIDRGARSVNRRAVFGARAAILPVMGVRRLPPTSRGQTPL